MNCVFCNQPIPFDLYHPYKIYCCADHRQKANHRNGRAVRTQREREARSQIPCGVCGKLFTPTASNRSYCSGGCKLEGYRLSKRRELNKTRAKPSKRICKWCGAEFESKGKRIYCCLDHQFLALYGHPAPKETAKVCSFCGNGFVTSDSKRIYCSSCSKKANHIAKNRRRRAIKRGAAHTNYSRYEIYKRDNFVCHICGKPIDMDAIVPDPCAPTLDHVVPLARGGGDTPDNVKAAHFICNSIKSDNPVDQTGPGVSENFPIGKRQARRAFRAKNFPNVENPG